MKYLAISMLPFLICPFICLNENRWSQAYLSLNFLGIILIYLLIVAIIRKYINIKYYAYASFFAFPVTFVASFFIIFFMTDIEKSKIEWIKNIPIISDIYIFIPVILFYILLSFTLGKIIEKIKEGSR